MLARAGEMDWLELLCLSGEDWAAGGEEGDTDRVVVKAAVHHFEKERMAGTLAGIRWCHREKDNSQCVTVFVVVAIVLWVCPHNPHSPQEASVCQWPSGGGEGLL